MIHTKLECVMNLTLELTFQWSKIISYDFKIIAVKLEHILKFLKLGFRAVKPVVEGVDILIVGHTNRQQLRRADRPFIRDGHTKPSNDSGLERCPGGLFTMVIYKLGKPNTRSRSEERRHQLEPMFINCKISRMKNIFKVGQGTLARKCQRHDQSIGSWPDHGARTSNRQCRKTTSLTRPDWSQTSSSEAGHLFVFEESFKRTLLCQEQQATIEYSTQRFGNSTFLGIQRRTRE